MATPQGTVLDQVRDLLDRADSFSFEAKRVMKPGPPDAAGFETMVPTEVVLLTISAIVPPKGE